ncbi:hypothetical protein [uncultured Pseudoteredinibacter sp.]|uniref:hypothetical protein n=1 Tax=uncultured Pseudoteredinibacter sp. TaxID=1641701 RepID=UPI00261A1C28|nr:hypothetical protein [uncultured Pseudoteredinibacter sp.]
MAAANKLLHRDFMDQIIANIFAEIEDTFVGVLESLEIKAEIYACGFWLFYCDYTVISPPCFAYNASYNEKYDRWAPSEWEVDVDDSVYDALTPVYEKLSKLMEGKSDEEWGKLIEYQWKFYSELCYKLNSEIHNQDSPFRGWPKCNDFVIGIFEEREGEEVYKELAISSLSYEKAKELCVI